MADAPLTKATVTIPGGLIISLEGPSSEEVMKMLQTIVGQFQSAGPVRKNSRQGKHVYNPDVEQEVIDYASDKPKGFLFGDMRAWLRRAEPLVRMALDVCLHKGSIVIADHRYRDGRFGPFKMLYGHPKFFEKGKQS